MPMNELDLQMILIEPTWGKLDLIPDLKGKLNTSTSDLIRLRNKLILQTKNNELSIEDANTIIENKSKENLWGLLSHLSKDLKLANLGVMSGEYDYCKNLLILAGDALRYNLPKVFTGAINEVASITCISDSKNGHKGKLLNTFTTENKQEIIEPQKKGLFGESKKNNGG